MPSFKMYKIIMAGLLLLLFAAPVFSAELSTYEGRVSSLDWVASKMVVKGVGSMEFYVPKEARVTKLGSSITFADLNILDFVIVRYYEDPSGKNTVVGITVKIV